MAEALLILTRHTDIPTWKTPFIWNRLIIWKFIDPFGTVVSCSKEKLIFGSFFRTNTETEWFKQRFNIACFHWIATGSVVNNVRQSDLKRYTHG